MSMKIAALASLLLVLSACAPTAPAPTASIGDTTSGPVQPVGDPKAIVTGLMVPWSIVPLGDGSTLISERDTETVKELMADGKLRDVGVVPDVVHHDEGGLLGLEVLDGEWLYAYYTAEDDNRVARFPLTGGPGSYAFGAPEVILTGIAKASWHNGGRIKFGPDGMLYVTTGDAAEIEHAQDLTSLNGKILRMTATGEVPDDNPFPGSLVYSYGHRNSQGLAWDDEGQLWAAEFGQETYDEINRIVPGGNYGWPLVEGIGEDDTYINPVIQWHTFEASPSGFVYMRGTFFVASLRGERIWALYPNGDSLDAVEWTPEVGRIRDVVPGPDGSLWFITSNTDGRGEYREGDDKLYQWNLDVMHEG